MAILEAKRAQFLRDDSHRRSELRGEMEAVAESAKDRALLGKAADRILLVLAEGPMSPGNITAKLTVSMRPHRDAALEHLRAMGKVSKGDDDRWALTL